MYYYLKNARTGEVGATEHKIFPEYVYINYIFNENFKDMTPTEIAYMVWLATNIGQKIDITMWNAKKSAYYNFLEKATANQWLTRLTDGTYSLSPNFASTTKPRWVNTSCKILIKEYQAAYSNPTNGNTKMLGWCVKLLPILNENWNVLCDEASCSGTYPPEFNYETQQQIANFLGRTKKTASTLFSDLQDFQYRISDTHGVPRFKRILREIPLGDGTFTYMISPYIFYKGDGFYKYAAMREFY